MDVAGPSGQDGPTMRASIELEPVAQSVSEACRFVATMLELWGCDDPDEVLGLLTSEVVTNAILHAGGQIRLQAVLAADGTMRVETFDTSPETPVIQSPAPYGGSGRGILIVQRLARCWGIESTDSHKVVWFELPTTRRPSD